MSDASYVAYLRVSTDRQGQSGLGIEAQRSRVAEFINGNGAKVIGEHVEVESGKVAQRPQLQRALEQCELTGAVLIVATLDRLTRDEAFLRTIREAGVRFKCADMPDADEFVLDIMARVARYERELISRRTKAALAAAKARGVRLGNPQGAAPMIPQRQAGGRKGATKQHAKAQQWAAKRRQVIEALEAAGISSLSATARALNDRGIQAPRGGRWTATAVRRLKERLEPSERP